MNFRMIGDAMALPSFSETTALVTVLEERSFRNAARKLGLSPARVSELVRNLEARLGVRLVERTSRSVAASPAGERLAGLLRLTVAPPAADLILAPVIGRFLSQYPQINIDVSVDRESVDIVAAGFDAGIRPGELLTRDMVCLRVSGEMPFVVVASPAYLQRCGIPKTPRELTKHACLRVRLPSGAWATWRFGKTGRALEVGIDGRLTANEPAIAVAAAVDGAGLLQIPLSYVAPELDAGRLVTVLDDWARPPVDGFFVYYPSRRHMRPPLKAFVDFLSGAYRRTPAGQKSPRRNRPAD